MTAVALQQPGRRPPHDLEAEQAVIGSLLLDGDGLVLVLDFLREADFYSVANGAMYAAASALFRTGRKIDPTTMAAELERSGKLASIGGRARLHELREQTVVAANVEHYAGIVRAASDKRALIRAGEESMRLGYDAGVEATDAMAQAQRRHYELGADLVGAGLVAVSTLLRPAMDQVEAQVNQGGDGVSGVSTGFPDLDRLTNGLKGGDLAIIAGRPSMGKTALCVQIATEAAAERHVPVAIFSLEMSREQLVERMLCERARVDSQRLQRGAIGDAEMERLIAALGPLGDAPLWIDDSSTLDDLTLRVKAQQAQARHGIELIVVDYLQLMREARGRRRDEGNRVQEVSAISRSLKAIARDLRVPVIAVSQLSRGPESRPDKRPLLSDLRDSGSLEQDADVVAFVFRDDYYSREKSEKPGVAEIIVAKHRNGPTGVVELMFRKELTRFESIDRRRGASRLDPDE